MTEDTQNIEAAATVDGETTTTQKHSHRFFQDEVPLAEPLNIPTVGSHQAQIVGAFVRDSKTGTPNPEGKEYVLTVELVAKDKMGKPYEVERVYSWERRSKTSLIKQFKAAFGNDVFTPDGKNHLPKLLADKPVTVVIGHAKSGKETKAVIKGLLPVEASTAAPAITEPILQAAA